MSGELRLSKSQVGLIDTILNRLRNLLFTWGLSGEAVMVTVEGDTVLTLGKAEYTYNGDSIKSSVGGSNKDLDILSRYLDDALAGLYEGVPYDIKYLKFDVNGKELIDGFLRDSIDDEACVDIKLW